MQKNASQITWSTTEPLELLAQQSERLYYSMQPAELRAAPWEVDERCWTALRADPADAAAAKLLFNLLRARHLDCPSAAELAPLKLFLDLVSVSQTPYGRKVGQALLEAPSVASPLAKSMQESGLSEDDLYADPQGVVEHFYPFEGSPPGKLTIAATVLAAFRGLVAEVPEMAPFALFLALQEALRFQGGECWPAANSAIQWFHSLHAVIRASLSAEQESGYGELAITLARHASTRERFEELAPRLAFARSFFAEDTDEYAECLFMQGECHERLGNLADALACYDAGLAVPPEDPRLLGALEASRASIRVSAEGDLGHFNMSPEALTAFGDDPGELEVWQQLSQATAEGGPLPESLVLTAIASLQRKIGDASSGSKNADHLLTWHVVIMKLLLSLEAPEKASVNIRHFLAAADAIIPSAEAATALQYRILRPKIIDRFDAR